MNESRSPTAPSEVVLYTRSGCHLCEEALEEIERAGCAADYSLRVIDVDTDPILREKFGSEIPVVLINGVKAFKYRLTAADFRAKLRRLARS